MLSITHGRTRCSERESRIQIGRLGPAQLDVAVDVLARAFLDGVTYRTLLPQLSSAQRLGLLRRIKRAATRSALRDGWVLGARLDSRVIGAALVLPPGAGWSLRSRGELALGLVQWPVLRALTGFLEVDRWTRAHHTRRPHYYLYFVGIDPAEQHHGVGGALMRHLLALADTEKAPVWLETANDSLVGYYARFGFEVVDDERLPGVSLRMRTMQREPQHPSAGE